MSLHITPVYAALLAIIGLVLAGNVGRTRAGVNISLGDGGNRDIIAANRRHMNFVEYVPLALILFMMIEINSGSKLLLHGLGGVLTLARVIHPFGIDPDVMNRPARIIGAGATFLVIIVAALVLLWQAFAK